MAFHIVDARLGSQPIAEASSTQQHPLGTMVRAVDTTYGEGVFIYLKGAASTAVGDVVSYDQKANTTEQIDVDMRGPVAVAMAATGASQYGWYQVRGSAVVNSDTVLAGNPAFPGTQLGRVDDDVSPTNKIDGMAFKTANGTPSAGKAVVEIAFPSMNGDGIP